MNTLESKSINLLIDFDSTIIKDESLELLSEISVKKSEDKIKISNITHDAMDGKISFSSALKKRVSLLKAKKQHVEDVIAIIQDRITESFVENKDFFNRNNSNCYIISGGFIEVIYPILKPFNISKKNIFANEFIYDDYKNIISVNQDNPLSKDKGKVEITKNILGKNIIIGDGYTDYEIKKYGLAKHFLAYTAHAKRINVINGADQICEDFNQVIEFIENNYNKL